MKPNAQNGHPLSYFVERTNWWLKTLWLLYCLELFPNGDGTGIILHKWHPLNYLMIALAIFVSIFLDGIRSVQTAWDCDKFGFTYTKYFTEHPESVEWIPRKTLFFKDTNT